MKRIPVALLLVFALLFVSCNNEEVKTPEQNDGSGATVVEKGLVTIDLSDLKSGQSITKTVTGDVEFQLEGLDFSDGVVIIDGDFIGASKSIGRGIGESDSLFKREDGTFIPVPDENKKSRFFGSDINILDLSTLHFKKLKLDDDFSISPDEYPNSVGIEEEFYYVDFSSQPWNKLNRSEVVFWLHNASVSSFSLVHWKCLRGRYNPRGILDFSSPSFHFGFGIDMFSSVGAETVLYVLNPIELKTGGLFTIDKNSQVSIFKVNAIEDGEQYKAVIHFSFEDYRNLDILSFFTQARYRDGSFRTEELVPYFNDDDYTVELEMGELDKEFIFTLDLTYGDMSDFTSASIELVKSERNQVYETLNAEEENKFYASSDSARQTIAIKTDEGLAVSIKPSSDSSLMRCFCTGEVTGTINPYGDVTLNKNTSYCFIVQSSGLKSGDALFTISPRESFELKCNVVYDGNYDYVCSGCENCGDGFTLNQLRINENKILKGEYWTTEEIGRYGRIAFKNGNGILTESQVLLNATSVGNGGISKTGAFGIYAFNKDNIHGDSIDIRVMEIHPNEKEIVVDIIVDEVDVYHTVMKYTKYEHVTHSWAIDGDETVKCTDCDEVRYSASMSVKKGVLYTMDANEDFSIWLVDRPEQEFFFKAGSSEAPEVPDDMNVRFVAPAAGKCISYEANGSHVTIIVQ